MATTPATGFLVIADLTGYTAYLSRAELEHAPTIAGDLLETVVGRLEPPFRLAKLEGDAAFLYVEDERADGALLVDALTAAYHAFRRRLRSIEVATSCSCQACGLAPRLDLKLFVHHGSWVRGRIAGRDELAGPSVILVHRLLKGTTADAAHDDAGAARGFALLTADAVAQLGRVRLGDGVTEAHEVIEHFGEVELLQVDLEGRWQAERDERRIDLVGVPSPIDLEVSLPAPTAEVWAALTSPSRRAAWEGAIVVLDDPDGPRGVGSRASCVTGRLAMLEEVVDWQPFDHLAYRLAVPGIGPVEATYDLTETTEGTSLALRMRLPPDAIVDPAAIERLRDERQGAFGRLPGVLGRDLARPGMEGSR